MCASRVFLLTSAVFVLSLGCASLRETRNSMDDIADTAEAADRVGRILERNTEHRNSISQSPREDERRIEERPRDGSAKNRFDPLRGTAEEPAGACRQENAMFKTQQGGCAYLPASLVFSAIANFRGEAIKLSTREASDYCAALTESDYSDWRLLGKDEVKLLAGKRADRHLSFLNVRGEQSWKYIWVAESSRYATRAYIVNGRLSDYASKSGYGFFCVRQQSS